MLAAGDVVVLFSAIYAAAIIRFRSLAEIASSVGELWPRAVLYTMALLLSFLALGLYTARQRARSVGLLVRIFAATILGTALTAISFYLLPSFRIGRGVVSIAAGLSFAATAGVRVLFSRVVNIDVLKRRVLIYGAGLRARSIVDLRRRTDRRGYVVIGFVAPRSEDLAVPLEHQLDASRGIRALCENQDIDEIVIAMDDRRRAFPIRDLLECRMAGIDVIDLVSFLERETGKVRTDLMNPSWMIFGGGFRRDQWRQASSRILDLIASSALLVLASPIMLLTALAILVEDRGRGGVFYRQERVGFAGRTFNLLKFRSMRADAEQAGHAQWAQKNDPRVTHIGAFIRRTRIDELPQIINVLAGKMSFVGPRPERPQFVAELSEKIPFYIQRHSVKPGITGWAQLCYPYGASEHDALQKLQYDLYYIKNNSFLFDLAILIQTAEVVVMGKGAR